MSDSRDGERDLRDGRRRESADGAAAAGTSAAIPEALSELLSAKLDGELDRADRETLARALSGDEPLAARAREFEAVDASLRALAQAGGLSDRGLREGFEALRSRLNGTESEFGTDVPGALAPVESDPTAAGRESAIARLDPGRRDRRVVGPILWAAAAALLLYLLSTLAPSVPGDESEVLTPSTVAEGPVGNEQRAAEEALALGYGEDPTDVTLAPGVPIDDLEIIEELEILEFLAARASEGRG